MPTRPRRRSAPIRVRSTARSTVRSRTPLSIASSRRRRPARAARSMRVRSGVVTGIESTTMMSTGSRLRVLWMVTHGSRERYGRSTSTSTGPGGNRSKPWSAAAAQWETTQPGPAESVATISRCRHFSGDPDTRTTPGAHRSSAPISTKRSTRGLDRRHAQVVAGHHAVFRGRRVRDRLERALHGHRAIPSPGWDTLPFRSASAPHTALDPDQNGGVGRVRRSGQVLPAIWRCTLTRTERGCVGVRSSA